MFWCVLLFFVHLWRLSKDNAMKTERLTHRMCHPRKEASPAHHNRYLRHVRAVLNQSGIVKPPRITVSEP